MKRNTRAKDVEAERDRHMAWWREARFGMFVHWGLYSQLGRHEWVMNRERIPVREYERLADTWRAKPRPAREWARLAKQAGMKYMVLTTKHHEGFCLWDTKQTDYNAVKRSPGRDLVREYVEACREFGLRVGFYYSLMDWHHPDGARCAKSEPARRRFLDYTQALVRELMTNYGKIDILWYDVSWPLPTPEAWESKKMNRMVRKLQPDIIINNRSRTPEDFGTPEERIRAADAGRDWEACMTFNGSWGYYPSIPPEDWHGVRKVLSMLREVRAGGGNLLLNIGPAPDGSVPPEAAERLIPVGQWLKKNGEAVYGFPERNGDCFAQERFTRKGAAAYYWRRYWAGREITLGGFKTKLKRVSLLATGRPFPFTQTARQIKITGLPAKCPDRIAGMAVFKLEFASMPRQRLGRGCVLL